MIRFQVGDDVYVQSPKRFIHDCSCIVGKVIASRHANGAQRLTVSASVGMIGGHPDAEMEFASIDLGHRIGTPITSLSGRPGHKGYARFVEIAQSWGYP